MKQSTRRMLAMLGAVTAMLGIATSAGAQTDPRIGLKAGMVGSPGTELEFAL